MVGDKQISIHRTSVSLSMNKIATELRQRGERHDQSKFSGIEHGMDDCYSKAFEYAATHGVSPKYVYTEVKDAQTPEMLLHYGENDHHPEHFNDSNGICDMTFINLIELACDLVSHAKERYMELSSLLDMVVNYFNPMWNLGDQLTNVLCNTITWIWKKG